MKKYWAPQMGYVSSFPDAMRTGSCIHSLSSPVNDYFLFLFTTSVVVHPWFRNKLTATGFPSQPWYIQRNISV